MNYIEYVGREIISRLPTMRNHSELTLLDHFLAAMLGTIGYEIVRYMQQSSFLIVVMPIIYIVVLVRKRTFCVHATRIYMHSKEQVTTSEAYRCH